MYNIRYHIASLVSVFLALALGLVLGGLVVQQGAVSKQQRSLVDSLQRDFKKLSTDNARLGTMLDLEQSYSTQMTNEWSKGRMAGRSVVIMTTGARDENVDAAVSAIREAGGTTAIVTVKNREFGLNNPAGAETIRSLVGSATDLRSAVATGLAVEWAQSTGPRPLTQALINSGAIGVTGLKSSIAATQALDLASFSQKPDEVALRVCRAYADAGYYALGAQTPTSRNGVAEAAVQLGLSAFDTLGTQPGRFTLVALYTGGQQGYFGLNADAVAQFPPVP